MAVDGNVGNFLVIPKFQTTDYNSSNMTLAFYTPTDRILFLMMCTDHPRLLCLDER